MTTINKGEYVFSVDIEKTKNYYKNHTLCDCKECLNYYAQIKDRFSELDVFLREFGVDVTRPDEISSIRTDNYIDYLSVYYSVCGKIKNENEYKTEISDSLPLNVLINREYAPNEQVGDYFTISVTGVKLPLC